MSEEDEFDGLDLPTFQPAEHKSAFDPEKYLKAFYATAKEDSAMQLVLFFLPGFAYMIPRKTTFLDVGCGPTVHVAMAFRKKVDEVYLADFAEQNRNALVKWWKKEDGFDWSEIVQLLASIEAEVGAGRKMPDETRARIRAVLDGDVHRPGVLTAPHYPPDAVFPAQFDVVASIFCLEYASRNSAEYQAAVKNLCGLVSPDGYLLMGGVTEARSYHFGGTRFMCHYLRISEVEECVEREGLRRVKFIQHGGIFLLLAQKGPPPANRPGEPCSAGQRASPV